MMEKSIGELIAESQEKAIRMAEYEREEETEKLRYRSFEESNNKILGWKNEHKKKRKTLVKISIVKDYSMHTDRAYYKLRLFVNKELIEIYNIDETAGINLTSGITPEPLGGLEFYTIYSNQ